MPDRHGAMPKACFRCGGTTRGTVCVGCDKADIQCTCVSLAEGVGGRRRGGAVPPASQNARMRFKVGAEQVTSVPVPGRASPGDGGRKLVTVPVGVVHAVDYRSGETACGATAVAEVFLWDWERSETVTRCPACVRALEWSAPGRGAATK